MSVWAVIVAAGQGTRLARAGLSTRKQFIPFEGAPLFWKSARTLARVSRVKGLVFVLPEAEFEEYAAIVRDLASRDDIVLPCLTVPGGERRQDSVLNGLRAIAETCDTVLVHDAARPFAGAQLANRLIDAVEQGDVAAIPAISVTDTIKRVTPEGLVAETLHRAELCAVQTPQAFALPTLIAAHEFCNAKGLDVTDDASMIEAAGGAVRVVPGEETNIKITNPEDLRMLTDNAPAPLPCVGWGYDVHKYGLGRPMKIGGVPIDGGPQVVAHSDGDVLLHALTDALLGCLGKGDIGQHFPDTDKAFSNIESAVLVNEVLTMAEEAELELCHVDLTVIAQIPKLSPYRERIRDNVARLLRIDAQRVNFKATTEEGLGFTGEKLGIKAVACVTALRHG
ncbi:2-C-methyl-D-erythritol 4-phosphate cytidylyltransferase/2-C-methyl-D-erythritol 2,4-cyclodiphosphate synthase [Desulfobaculum xiamenense]|uniref:Bifunctional enzyme IspD/IspF n=1 Tax=Desulfobaculum xiamenense TaxID=995050 RepID=A0A846QFA8_9BACT|nr:2-C-methyl-D-erythritol 4-phosphate cytidylyltransferase [Desulfobaculum xiamenense]NJB66931.1 2-C-methyl-D-erythritol 4-phosphate cytidylyltransferase/2-C-methyl-D-erythritol 2,4-cyclodiphosphate synthase [Desulfobaculum xiamenense]